MRVERSLKCKILTTLVAKRRAININLNYPAKYNILKSIIFYF